MVMFFSSLLSSLSLSLSLLALFLMFQISKHRTFLSRIECALRSVLEVDFFVSLFLSVYQISYESFIFSLHFIRARKCVSSIERYETSSNIYAFFILLSLTTRRRQNIITKQQRKRNYFVSILTA